MSDVIIDTNVMVVTLNANGIAVNFLCGDQPGRWFVPQEEKN